MTIRVHAFTLAKLRAMDHHQSCLRGPVFQGGNHIKREQKKKILWLLAALGASACIYTALFKVSGMDLAGIARVWSGADWVFLSGVLVFSIAVHALMGADKLRRVLASVGMDLPYKEVLKIRLGAGPLWALMPVDAGEVLNIIFFRRYKKMAVGDASGACLFDRGLNFLGTVFWLMMGLVFISQEPGRTGPKAMAAVLTGAAYFLFLFASPLHSFIISLGGRMHSKIGDFAEGVFGPFSKCSAGQKIFFCMYGIIFQSRPLIVCYFLLSALGIHAGPGEIMAFTTLAMLAGHLPAAGGVGPREAAIVVLFAGQAPAGTLLAVGAAMSLFVHILPMLAGIPWAPWFLRGIAQGSEAQ